MWNTIIYKNYDLKKQWLLVEKKLNAIGIFPTVWLPLPDMKSPIQWFFAGGVCIPDQHLVCQLLNLGSWNRKRTIMF